MGCTQRRAKNEKQEHFIFCLLHVWLHPVKYTLYTYRIVYCIINPFTK